MQKRTKSKRGPVISGLISVGISAAVLVMCALLASALTYASKDPSGVIGAYSLAALLLGAVISGAVTSRKGGVAHSALVTLAFAAVIMLWGLIASAGKLPGSCLMNCGCYLGVGVGSAFLFRKRERRTSKRRR